ncbi:MAG: 4-hydroxyphenylacetate 3-monooxygenase, oxygenase component [Woeseiaceae bacterium]|nr:4-hydroxyphenylacetate 3-monooxygenase, oxygenase component [Woeseiaceae bacterium]
MSNVSDLPKGDGIRNGKQYLEDLRDDRDVWIHGEKVKDVTTHPSLCRGAETLAGFLDRQFDDQCKDTVTYEENGGTYATSFMIPKSVDDIKKRGESAYEWARWSNGMFGRTPDYKNASVMAFAASAKFLEEGRPEFAENMRNYYEYVRTNDKVLTHTLINPTYNFEEAKQGRSSEKVALQVVKETDSGLVVNGARLLATLGPHADEIEVFPSSLLTANEDNLPYAFAFTIPTGAPGVRMICRDTYDHQKSTYDAPLSSRFEEMDAVIIFDNVHVPWERVFMYRDPLLCNRAFAETHAVVHMMHQVICGKLAKTEFIVGLLCAMAKATGKDKDMNVKGMIAEAMWVAETLRALRYHGESEAHEDQWGNYVALRRPLDTSRNTYPKLYPRLIEMIQMLGSSSLIATPTEADLGNALSEDVAKYFQTVNLKSEDRIALFRLAHDVAVSGFGNRQVLYERFFFGPQNIMASIYYDLYNKDDMMDKVTEILNR